MHFHSDLLHTSFLHMAKSTTTKKVAAKKVASKVESKPEIPIAEKTTEVESKKVKRVSISKPKALVEKTVKKEEISIDINNDIEKKVKPSRKSSKKATVKEAPAEEISVDDSPKQSLEVTIAETETQFKGKGLSTRKSPKKKQVESNKLTPQPIEGKTSEQTLSVDENIDNNRSVHQDGNPISDDASMNGEERLSRKERRLREWKERKKLKRLQHLQERQGKIIGDVPESNAEKTISEEHHSEAIVDIPEIVIPKEKSPKANEKQPLEKLPLEKQQVEKPNQPKTQDNQSKVLPLDKVGRDFPPLKKVETWGNAMSKAKVEPLPKQLEPLLQKTVHFLEQEIRIKKPSVILVGVSGGIDSVVLLDLLSVISTRGWCTIHVAHCNHQLRGEASHQDELFVRRLASKYGLHFHHTSADVAGYSREYNLGIETAARIMRYQFFEKAAKACHADSIATAHHSEDNAETLLMNLMRGSGITGLAGIPPRRDVDKKLSYIRPILWLSKKEIEHYAKVRNLEWREDESNTAMNFTRNKIRHELLPMLRAEYSPGLTDILNRTTTLMREAQEFIAERIIHIMKQGVREVSKTSFAINIGMFQTIKDFAKGELIQASLRHHLRMQPISMIAIDSILNLAQGPAGGRLDITKDLFVIRDREDLVFARPELAVEIFMPVMKLGTYSAHGIGYNAEIADPRSVNFGEHPLIEYFDADIFPEQCVIRHWRDGDRIAPIGMDGSMTVSDFLTNAKINVVDKRKVLVLCSGDEVLWVIGYRIHNGYKVTQQTESIMRVTIALDKQINYLQSQHKQGKSNQKPQHKNQPKKQNVNPQEKTAIEEVKSSTEEVVLKPVEKKSKKNKSNASSSRRSPRTSKDN